MCEGREGTAVDSHALRGHELRLLGLLIAVFPWAPSVLRKNSLSTVADTYVPVLGRLDQENHKFWTILGYIVGPHKVHPRLRLRITTSLHLYL